jgi:redox-sensing transcriptional repressor
MVFDSDPTKIGNKIGAFVVQDSAKMVSEIKKAGVKVAMSAVPADKAQEVANQLVEAGVRAILNYAPVSINVPAGVRVQHIDPTTHLQRMTYYLD